MDAPADPPAFLPPRYPGEDFAPGQFRDAYPSTTPSEPEEYYADESRLNASLLVDDDDTNLSSLELQEEGGHSLPTADEVRNANAMENNPYSGRRKRMWALLGVGLLVLTLIIALSVAVPRQKENKSVSGSSSALDGVDDGNSATGGNQGTTDPLRNPNAALQVGVSRYQQVTEYIVSRGITAADKYADKEGPQHRAALWIADYDPLQLAIPETGNFEFEQRYILATFYYALDGPNWRSDLKFLSGSSVCDWNLPFDLVNELGKQSTWDQGVTCGDTKNAEILFIAGNGLSGELPPELGFLSTLWHLSLYDNDLSGALPSEMQHLTKLWFVGLEENNLEGPIPSWINKWTDLEFLALGTNWFSGSLPSFAGLTKLKEISLYENELTGSIDSLNQATSLTAIFANTNSFSGRLHSTTLGNLKKLQTLDLSDNDLTGYFPEHFYGIKNVVLAENQLTGQLPDVTATGLPIEVLSLHNNGISGDVPAKIGLLSNLIHLDLSHNRLDGEVFDSVNGLTKLQFLLLSHNPLTPGRIPVMSSLKVLQDLSLGNTNRSGPIPTGLGTLTSLRLLDLHGNQLTGAIPTQLATIPNLRFLSLNRNSLTGGVPDELAALTDLYTFYMDHNNITGNVGEICLNGGSDNLKMFVTDCEVECPCCNEGTCCAEFDDACNKEELLTKFRKEYVRVEFIFNENVALNTTAV
ncbi:hypothetical protein FisN_8Hh358 [Fistulifera solaris]|uniref:L domain-like protein n=1 Tax=Fistulifera solaris TaxID=1519565 RepID=A0A1Z5KHE6_FISSO|nr:hypothetical protein FisN_8Hh358 [Fistulifera solaris]|eukprot:GAX25743.1 hypothetical protein FisN_8Hh358 [Fistulifera solaris]